MKDKIFLFLLIVTLNFCTDLLAQTNSNHVYVRGYTRSDGTQVQGHYRTSPNSTVNDNFSTRGNTNPYTGQAGYLPRESSTVKPTTSYYNSPSYHTTPSNPSASYNSTTSSSSYSTSNSCIDEIVVLKSRLDEMHIQLSAEKNRRMAIEKASNYSITDSIISDNDSIDYIVNSSVNDSLIKQWEAQIARTDSLVAALKFEEQEVEVPTIEYINTNENDGIFIFIIILLFIALLWSLTRNQKVKSA